MILASGPAHVRRPLVSRSRQTVPVLDGALHDPQRALAAVAVGRGGHRSWSGRRTRSHRRTRPPTPTGRVPGAELLQPGSGGGDEPRRHRRLRRRTGSHIADLLEGGVLVVPGRHPSEGGGDHVLGQQVHGLACVPGVQADLTGPIRGAQAGLSTGTRRPPNGTVACSVPWQTAVRSGLWRPLRAGLLSHLGGQELVQHAKPDRDRGGQQAVACGSGTP